MEPYVLVLYMPSWHRQQQLQRLAPQSYKIPKLVVMFTKLHNQVTSSISSVKGASDFSRCIIYIYIKVIPLQARCGSEGG